MSLSNFKFDLTLPVLTYYHGQGGDPLATLVLETKSQRKNGASTDSWPWPMAINMNYPYLSVELEVS